MVIINSTQIHDIGKLNTQFRTTFKKVKTVFSDIDGTTVMSQTTPSGRIETIPERTIEAIDNLRANKINYIPTTGSTYCNINNFIKEANINANSIITQNGAVIFKNNKINSIIELPKNILRNIIGEISGVVEHQPTSGSIQVKFRNPFDEQARTLDESQSYIDCCRDRLTSIYLFVSDSVAKHNLAEHLGGNFKNLFVCETRSGIDILGNISKDKAISSIAIRDRFQLAESAAIGDGKNDRSMMNLIDSNNGITIAMGNGIENLKQHCKFFTQSIDKDGFFNAMAEILKYNKNYRQN